jgi:hypothetical protein
MDESTDAPQGASTPEAAELATELEQTKTREQLEREAKRRGVTPTSGSGAGGGVVKEDLAEAIAEDEVAPEDTSGRPPLAEVAESRAADVVIKRLPAQEED